MESKIYNGLQGRVYNGRTCELTRGQRAMMQITKKKKCQLLHSIPVVIVWVAFRHHVNQVFNLGAQLKAISIER